MYNLLYCYKITRILEYIYINKYNKIIIWCAVTVNCIDMLRNSRATSAIKALALTFRLMTAERAAPTNVIYVSFITQHNNDNNRKCRVHLYPDAYFSLDSYFCYLQLNHKNKINLKLIRYK